MHLTPDQFETRQRSLEAAFFQKVDAQLIANLKGQLAHMEETHKLSHVSDILDQNVLQDLVRAGVTAETLLAMRFVPMIRVAWADRHISPEEQAAVLKAAEAESLKPGSPAFELLRSWLEQPPQDAIFTVWREYVQALAQTMPRGACVELRNRTEVLCTQVAKAAGGILGWGAISTAEQQAIEECLKTYDLD